MLMSTVVAVALGLTPARSADAEIVTGDYSTKVGHYSQVVDRAGKTHVKGVDARGFPYELLMDRNGNVEATVHDNASFAYRVIAFRVQESG